MEKFHKFLQDIVLKKISKKELLIRLQLACEDFHGLDTLTFGRWIKGTSKPSLHKQLLIAQSCQCLSEYMDTFEEAKVSSVDERIFTNYLSRFDAPYHHILAFEHEEYLFHSRGKNTDLYPYVQRFSDKLEALKSITEQAHSLYAPINVELLAIGEQDNMAVESFIWMQHGLNVHLDCLGITRNESDYSEKNCVAITLSYYRSSEHFLLLCGLLVNLILEHYSNKQKLVIQFRGLQGLMLSETLGGKSICSLPDATFGNLYIHEFDFLRFFANPVILNIAKKYVNTYRKHFTTLTRHPIRLSDLG